VHCALDGVRRRLPGAGRVHGLAVAQLSSLFFQNFVPATAAPISSPVFVSV
jgi:hypothetical protein